VDTNLTPEEKKLIEHAKEAVVKYNSIRHANGGIDTVYAFLLSESGQIYDGAALEPSIICAERHAVANLTLQESYNAKIRAIIVAEPVPGVQEEGLSPCGACREVIWNHGRPETTVILMQYVQGKNGWTFPKNQKYLIKDFYPHPCELKDDLWDNWQPK
jgi:cytidine deaminase